MRIGVDLGGTKIEAAAFDEEGGEVFRRRVPTPADNYQSILAEIDGLVAGAERAADSSGTVGVGTPGAISPFTGLLRNSNSQVLNGQPLDKDLEKVLDRPVRLENDANCFALSEAVDGAGRGYHTVFGVILGTGVGGGLVMDGNLWSGPNRIAGEWGHNLLPKESEDKLCYCGRRNCVELFLSGPGIVAWYQQTTGRSKTAEEITSLVPYDPAAFRALDVYMDRLAKGLAMVINIVDPNVIVLGGGLSNVDNLYEEVPRRWGQWVFSDQVATRLVRNHHGDSSGVRGAAWLWPVDKDSVAG